MIDSHGGPREGADVYVGPSVEHGHPTAQKDIAIGVILADGASRPRVSRRARGAILRA